ncbi:MAG: hypothetical protein XXXJIFNMEKO3_03160 [Candidatus Erwinia impunctatus]|nr:hypothetical protein XXXJIFNMEKO_03160 [Culicoides impunctatus]
MAHYLSFSVIRFSPLVFLSLLFSSAVSAVDQQFIHQEQQQKALEQQLTPATPDVRLSPVATSGGKLIFPAEKPCFPIQQVKLTGQDALPHWLPLRLITARAEGFCLELRVLTC